MANEKILLVEDDLDLSNIVGDFLINEGYHLVKAFNGESAVLEAGSFLPDLIILDIMLPKIDGIEVCRRIRQSSHAPIIIVSAKTSDTDKLLSLGVGADDYMTKPFSMVELIARVKAHLRRFTSFGGDSASAQSALSFGRLTINPMAHTVFADEEEIILTSREFKLLEFLSSHPGQVFSKEQLANQVWGYHDFIDDNTIAVYIGRLREKLKAKELYFIKTVWGVGYKWQI